MNFWDSKQLQIKNFVNYKAIEHIDHCKYGIDHVNNQGPLKILNFKF